MTVCDLCADEGLSLCHCPIPVGNSWYDPPMGDMDDGFHDRDLNPEKYGGKPCCSPNTKVGGPLADALMKARDDGEKRAAEVKEMFEKAFITATGDEDIDVALRECVAILGTKGQDYTVGKNQTDRLFNFRVGAEAAGIDPTQVWYVYFWKHLTAIQRFVKEGKVDSEGIEGRVNDAINYLLLFRKIIAERKRGNI